ncbi:uncharacterized protein N7459_007463 [Penicillium hispanicum]|uniref:uncharacterized protein n=1 Tax=Penicillium hispanicum TaxID=1080232 RepID=UPI002542558B|nr:uncharacterized protein N7459_007463 [Penicillium hispanicum]KAJ5578499.1 hypothetical protein N7459_007463 [Penicillium hispanicum]
MMKLGKSNFTDNTLTTPIFLSIVPPSQGMVDGNTDRVIGYTAQRADRKRHLLYHKNQTVDVIYGRVWTGGVVAGDGWLADFHVESPPERFRVVVLRILLQELAHFGEVAKHGDLELVGGGNLHETAPHEGTQVPDHGLGRACGDGLGEIHAGLEMGT